MEFSKNSSKREVYGNKILPQETRKPEISNLSIHLKQLKKKEQRQPKVSRRKLIIKIRAEVNEVEIKKTISRKDQRNFGGL